MKRTLIALAVLGSAALAILPQVVRSQVPGQPGQGLPFGLGPGDKGATLKTPWLESNTSPAPVPSSTTPNYIQGLLQANGVSQQSAAMPAGPSSLLPYETTSINNDILVTPEMGPWMILLSTYAGPDGPMRARQMVCALRTVYKLPAYVFNYGAEEKRKELERVKGLIEKQKEALKQNNLAFDQPIHIRHAKIDEHCGVLVGGYPTQEAANRAREQLRKIKLDRDDVRNFTLKEPGDLLDRKFYQREDNAKDRPKEEIAFVNPFTHNFVVRNPTIKVERPADAGKLDIAALKRMNSEEAYNLLKCPKNYTLLIKQFEMPAVTSVRSDGKQSSGLLEGMGFGKKAIDPTDYAALNAHKFAEALRERKLEAYVLHMKYQSLVTIGGFDDINDPNLRSMQNMIETRLVPALEVLQLFPKAMPMPIPH
jgi:hypothetical protein